MTKAKHHKQLEYFSLLVSILITIAAINNNKVSVFYIIYLFWFDELIKTIFDFIKIFYKKNIISNKQQHKSILKSRFFCLFVYFIFIIVFFCFMIDSNNQEAIILNLQTLLFKTPLFNLSVATVVLKEVYLLFNEKKLVYIHHIFSKGIITLHVSVVLGILFWFIISKNFQELKAYTVIASIIPFLVLKMYFEIQEINNKYNLL